MRRCRRCRLPRTRWRRLVLSWAAKVSWRSSSKAGPGDPGSAAIIASIGATASLRPDFGSGTWDGGPIGIPYVVVSGSQAKVTIRFTAYASESEPGPYPVPRTAPIYVTAGFEGPRTGDEHPQFYPDRFTFEERGLLLNQRKQP